jgi:hypothetical protein
MYIVMKIRYVVTSFLIFLGTFVLPASHAYAYRFVIYGDSRGPRGDPSVVFNREILGAINAKIAKLHPRPKFAFFLGDCITPAWAHNYVKNNFIEWMQFMKQSLNGIPFYTVVGNNDLYGNTGWTEFPLQTQFQKFFASLPSNGPRHYKKLAYSVEYGEGAERCLFVVLDSFGFYKRNGELVNFDNGVDQEQLKWFATQAKNSKAHYKFAISHGPAFSIEGWAVDPSISQVWKLMDKHHFDGLYCSHEHIFSRWNINASVYPQAKHTMIQTITGSAGSPLDDIALVKVDFHKAHIFRGYTYTVVDIRKGKMIQRSYGLRPQGNGYTFCLIDTFVRKKG